MQLSSKNIAKKKKSHNGLRKFVILCWATLTAACGNQNLMAFLTEFKEMLYVKGAFCTLLGGNACAFWRNKQIKEMNASQVSTG